MVEFKNIVSVEILVFEVEGVRVDESPAVEEGVDAHEPAHVFAEELGGVFGGHVLIGGEEVLVINLNYFISVVEVFL